MDAQCPPRRAPRFNSVLKVIPERPAKRVLRELLAASYFRHFPEKVVWKVLGVTCDWVRIARSKPARAMLDLPQSLWYAELKTATWKVLDDENPFYILVDLDAAWAHFERLKPWHSFDWIAKRLGWAMRRSTASSHLACSIQRSRRSKTRSLVRKS